VPTFVGAYAPRMVAEAPRWVDELRPPGMWAAGFFRDVQRRAREAAGDQRFRVGCDVWISLGDDRAEARALGRRILAQFLPLPVFRPHVEFQEVDRAEIAAVGEAMRAGDVAAAARLVSDATLDTFVAAGTVADVVAGLERLLEAGPSTVTFSGRLGPDPARALELLGGEVLPAVA
jgi:5,10-methylenetetrahydromethanopterin reductase